MGSTLLNWNLTMSKLNSFPEYLFMGTLKMQDPIGNCCHFIKTGIMWNKASLWRISPNERKKWANSKVENSSQILKKKKLNIKVIWPETFKNIYTWLNLRTSPALTDVKCSQPKNVLQSTTLRGSGLTVEPNRYT